MGEAEARTDSTRLNGGHDAVVVIAVYAVRGSRLGTKTVAAGHRRVVANREAALTAAKSNERDAARRRPGIVKHDVLSSSWVMAMPWRTDIHR